jgi:hypothetical protein
MCMTGSLRRIDYDIVSYPSDSLTVKTLRLQYGRDVFADEDRQLDEMLGWEQCCVEIGFRVAQGEREQEMEFGLSSAREVEAHLMRLYKRFRIADGNESGKELVRQLKEAGRAQATDRRR